MGLKVPVISDNFHFVGKIGATKVPTSTNSTHHTPTFYQAGFETSSMFGNDADQMGRGLVGLAFAKDEFWQYTENDKFVDNSKRIILYGTVAMSENNTVLLHTYINANTKGNGPSEVGLRLSYGGNWEKLLGFLGGGK